MKKNGKSSARRASASKQTPPAKRAAQYLSVATDRNKGASERVAALAEAPLAICENEKNLQDALNLLLDRTQPLEVRLATLQTVQAASFSVAEFEPRRSEYIAALRKAVQDPEPELRQRVLGILAREKDSFAQKKLLEGLKNPGKALVPAEKALQLLSYDIHADAYPIAREIVNKSQNGVAKREALRLLAADAGSAPMFEKILRDKGEAAEYRQISAAALQGIQPEKLQSHAREILLDASDAEEVQATSLAALTEFGESKALAEDKPLMDRVTRLSGRQAGDSMTQCANRFLEKYGAKGGQ
jgi:hypothetical protein